MASAAGTPVDDACVLKYKDLKSKRKYKFVTYKIENNSIVVATEGAPTASFDDFIEALPESEPRYVEAPPPPPPGAGGTRAPPPARRGLAPRANRRGAPRAAPATRTALLWREPKALSHRSLTLSSFPPPKHRYAVFDFEFDRDGCKKSKIVFVTWVPDTSPIRSKMLYASSKDKFKRDLDGIQVEIQGTDFSEVEEKVFIDKMGLF